MSLRDRMEQDSRSPHSGSGAGPGTGQQEARRLSGAAQLWGGQGVPAGCRRPRGDPRHLMAFWGQPSPLLALHPLVGSVWSCTEEGTETQILSVNTDSIEPAAVHAPGPQACLEVGVLEGQRHRCRPLC